VPSFLQEGTAYRKRKEQHLTMRRILASVGWTKENKESKATITESIKPLKTRSAAEWKSETLKYRQSLLDLRKETNDSITSAKSSEASNIVKVVDKSYLEKSYHAGQGHAFIEESIIRFSLNREQERAFQIIANHASNPHSAQLKIYIGGMGGTGKTQVLKALSHFFELRKETNRFVVVAPTGTAASLLGGSTYHYMFGINEHSGTLSNFARGIRHNISITRRSYW
jgi:chromosomal replication initiation ATPase DnaA